MLPFLSIVNTLPLESNKLVIINFDTGDLSSATGLLLMKEFILKLWIHFNNIPPHILAIYFLHYQ